MRILQHSKISWGKRQRKNCYQKLGGGLLFKTKTVSLETVIILILIIAVNLFKMSIFFLDIVSIGMIKKKKAKKKFGLERIRLHLLLLQRNLELLAAQRVLVVIKQILVILFRNLVLCKMKMTMVDQPKWTKLIRTTKLTSIRLNLDANF